jgi:CBS-domain-containing membrane protein
MTEPPGGGALDAVQRRAGRLGAAGYAFALCVVALAAAGALGLLVKQPYLFPSLGPTVMLFFGTPTHPSAAPRNSLIGHGVALLAGVGCLALFGLTDHRPAIEEGLTSARVAAAALSVALTALVLRLIDSPHPPAGATTLIVSLGLLTSTSELLAIAAGVVLVTVLSVALNRVLGVRQPFWA